MCTFFIGLAGKNVYGRWDIGCEDAPLFTVARKKNI